MRETPIKIGVFTSNTSMLDHIKRIAATDNEVSISIAHHGLDKAVPIGRKMEKDGIEVLISRRGTAHLLRENLQIPVLSFPQSDLEIILSLQQASRIGNRILLPTFRNKLDRIEDLLSMLKINAVMRVYEDTASLEEIIQKAKNQGCDVVVGGPFSVAFAKEYGLKTVELQSSEDAIIATIEDAKSVVYSNRKEHENAYKYQAIINSASEGVIAVDKIGCVTILNSAAKAMLGIHKDVILGKNISSIIKKSPLMKSMEDAKPIYDSIESIGDNNFVFNHTPIILNDSVVGGVSTFKDVGNVIKSEIKVRKKLSKGLVANYKITDLIHKSSEMQDLIKRATKYSKTNSTILITGETGTGKEILAQSIHNLSSRAKNPFVSINCAAIPEQLLESELFGYEEGAFTGSRKGGKPGLFELAHTGTIFLDEISAAPESVQTRLLRVLQEREVMRIGSDQLIPIDVRVIAAANKDLASEVKKNNFREDLFFRLNVLIINVPPLRQRIDDIPLLADKFIEDISKEYGYSKFGIHNNYMKLLFEYSWPGNIRQFRNFIERLVLLSESTFDAVIFEELHNELLLYGDEESKTDTEFHIMDNKDNLPGQFKLQRDEQERKMLQKVLYETHFNKSDAAKMLGISRTTLWRKIRELGLD